MIERKYSKVDGVTCYLCGKENMRRFYEQPVFIKPSKIVNETNMAQCVLGWGVKPRKSRYQSKPCCGHCHNVLGSKDYSLNQAEAVIKRKHRMVAKALGRDEWVLDLILTTKRRGV